MENTTTNTINLKNKSKNPKKLLIIGGAALVVIVAGCFSWYYFKKRKRKTEDYDTTTIPSRKPSSGFSCKSNTYPLQYGSCHPDIGILQHYLKTTHNAHLGSYGKNHDGIDNKFGKVTRDAARKYLYKEIFTKKDIALFAAALKIKKS